MVDKLDPNTNDRLVHNGALVRVSWSRSANNLPGYVIDYVKTRYVSACAKCVAHLK